jgi:hypothetical protein
MHIYLRERYHDDPTLAMASIETREGCQELLKWVSLLSPEDRRATLVSLGPTKKDKRFKLIHVSGLSDNMDGYYVIAEELLEVIGEKPGLKVFE